MSELVIEPFTNEFGQVINPGDEIIFAATAWKSTSIRKGIFGGVHYANVTRTEYLTDESGRYIKEDYVDRWSGKTYQRNKQKTTTTREVVAVRVEKVNRGFKYNCGYDENGKYRATKTDEVQYGVSTLPLKRVYKIDTGMSAMVGKSF